MEQIYEHTDGEDERDGWDGEREDATGIYSGVTRRPTIENIHAVTVAQKCIDDMITAGQQGVVRARDIDLVKIWNDLSIRPELRTGPNRWNLYRVDYHTHFEHPPKTQLMIDLDTALSNGTINSNPERITYLFKKSIADVEAHQALIDEQMKLHPYTTYIILAQDNYAKTMNLPMIIEPERYPTVEFVESANAFRISKLYLWGVSKYST